MVAGWYLRSNRNFFFKRGESIAFASNPGKERGWGLTMEKRLGAYCWREKFRWVREGEDDEGKLAGNRQNGPGQDNRA